MKAEEILNEVYLEKGSPCEMDNNPRAWKEIAIQAMEEYASLKQDELIEKIENEIGDTDTFSPINLHLFLRSLKSK